MYRRLKQKAKISLAIITVSFAFFPEICGDQNQNKPKSLVNIVRNLNSLVEGLLDSKIEGHLNQVLVKYVINEALYCKYVTGVLHYKLKLVLKYKKNGAIYLLSEWNPGHHGGKIRVNFKPEAEVFDYYGLKNATKITQIKH